MFIEIHVDGIETPYVLPIEKAGKIGRELELKGKKFRLGKTIQ
jgi:hypothetical protein